MWQAPFEGLCQFTYLVTVPYRNFPTEGRRDSEFAVGAAIGACKTKVGYEEVRVSGAAVRYKPCALSCKGGAVMVKVLGTAPSSFSSKNGCDRRSLTIGRTLTVIRGKTSVVSIKKRSAHPKFSPIPRSRRLGHILPIVRTVSGRMSIPVSVSACGTRITERTVKTKTRVVGSI